MRMLFVCRLVFFVACLITGVYSLYYLKKNFRPSYFKCTFFGITAQLLASLFYLALSTDDSLTSPFSLGIFGEVSFYLFVTTANTRFIPKEEAELQRHISIPGMFCAVLLALAYLFVGWCDSAADHLVCVLIYSIGMIPCSYTCAKAVANKFDNPFKTGITPFCITIIGIILSSTALQVAFALENDAVLRMILPITTTISVLCMLLSMHLLKRGLEPWEL